jgi:hypothetical protein
MLDQARLSAMDTCCTASLRQVRTREPSGHNICCRKLIHCPDVAQDRHPRETLLQDSPGRLPHLAEQLGVGSGVVKAQLKPAYAGEQARYRECCTLRNGRSTRHEHMFPQRAVKYWEATTSG